MTNIPVLFRSTRTVRSLKAYMDSAFSEVLHTTLNPDGPWQYKTEKEYLCVRNGEERGLTAAFRETVLRADANTNNGYNHF